MSQKQQDQHSENQRVLGELVAKAEQSIADRAEIRASQIRIFQKLEEISAALPDKFASREALENQNRRLVKLELDNQRRLGERTAIGTACLAIGAAVGWVIEFFHK